MIDFRDDGRIAIDFDGKPITLRPPKIREFEEMLRLADELDAELEEVSDIREKLREPDPEKRRENPVTPAETDRYMRVARSVPARFVKRAIELLGDRDGPDDLDDYPAFIQDLTLPTRFQTHWQTVPLGSSPNARRPTP